MRSPRRKNVAGMWLLYGVGIAGAPPSSQHNGGAFMPLRTRKNRVTPAPRLLTTSDLAAYITPSRCAARFGVVGASAKLLMIRVFDTRTGVRSRSEAWASTALRASGGWGHPVPGCLIGESEERETWTAESLRTAAWRGGNLSTAAVGRDFGGTRFRSTPFGHVSNRVGDTVGPRQNVT